MAKLPSTQSHLDIYDIRDNLLVLKNGNMSMIMETSSLNFELFAEEEQDARIVAFAALLNSLKFKIQIVIRTERARVDDYIEKLVQQRDQHTSKALQKQMDIYIRFVQNLTNKTEVLNKRFLVIVTTAFPLSSGNKSLFGIFSSKPKKVSVYRNLEKAKDYLYPKREFLYKQFKKMGIDAVQLNNDQLIQLFYDIYDPDKVGIKRINLKQSDYTTGMVEPATSDLVDELLNKQKQKIQNG